MQDAGIEPSRLNICFLVRLRHHALGSSKWQDSLRAIPCYPDVTCVRCLFSCLQISSMQQQVFQYVPGSYTVSELTLISFSKLYSVYKTVLCSTNVIKFEYNHTPALVQDPEITQPPNCISTFAKISTNARSRVRPFWRFLQFLLLGRLRVRRLPFTSSTERNIPPHSLFRAV